MAEMKKMKSLFLHTGGFGNTQWEFVVLHVNAVKTTGCATLGCCWEQQQL